MHLIDPDILAAARGISEGICCAGIATGALLWGFGWRWHRFWIAVGITVSAGLYGLAIGASVGTQTTAIGVLTAISAGLLALELTRILAFILGGSVAWYAAAAIFPIVQHVEIIVLGGGLAGLVFYRIGIMLATALIGSLVAVHSGIVLAESISPFDPAAWSKANSLGLSVGISLLTLLGLAVQGAQARWRAEEDREEARQERRWGRQFFRRGWRLTRSERSLRDVFAKP